MIAGYIRAWPTETAAHWVITPATASPLDGAPSVLGRVALRLIDLEEGTAEIAYWVTAAARGRGIAVQAARTLSYWALDDLGLHRLELQHSVANTASCRVADKAGYTRRPRGRRDGTIRDT